MYAELYPFAFNYNNNKNATGELIKNMCWLVQAQTHQDRTLGEVRSGRKWIKGAHFHKKGISIS